MPKSSEQVQTDAPVEVSQGMVLLNDSDPADLLVVREVADDGVDMSAYRSELIAEASRRVKARHAEVEKWAKLSAEYREKKKAKLDELHGKKEAKLESLKVKLAEYEATQWTVQRQRADEMDSEITERKKVLLMSLAEEKSQLEARLRKLPKDLGNGASVAYINDVEDELATKDDYLSRLIVGARNGKDAIVAQVMTEIGYWNTEVNSADVFKMIWLKHLYPLIAEQAETEKGFVYADGALPKPNNKASFKSFYDRYSKKLIAPIMRFFCSITTATGQILCTESFVKRLHSHCEEVSEGTLSWSGSMEKDDRNIHFGSWEIDTSVSNVARRCGVEDRAAKQFLLLMTALLDFGLPKEKFTVSQFLDFVQRMVVSETYFGIKFQGNELVEKNRQELRDFMARFVEEELLVISGYADYFPGLMHRKMKPTKENWEKLLMEMQEILWRSSLKKEQTAIVTDLKKVDGYLGDIDGHPEVVELKNRQSFLREAPYLSDQYMAGDRERSDLEQREFLDEEDKAQAYRMLLEWTRISVEHEKRKEACKELKSAPVTDYLIGARVSDMPCFTDELKVLLLKKHFGYKLRVIVFEAKSDRDKNSVEGRAEKRALDMENEFLIDLEQMFVVNGSSGAIAVKINKEVFKEFGFDRARDVAPWWYKIKGLLGLFNTKLLTFFATKQSLFEELSVHEDLESFFSLNEWLFKLHKVGLVLMQSVDEKTRELGELHLEIARILQEKFKTLPESIEARLAVPEVDLGNLAETLSVLPSILRRQGQAQLLDSLEEAAGASEDLVVLLDAKKDFDARLALAEAAKPDSDQGK